MASTDIFNGKAFVPDWMARWWEFDQAFSAKVMAGGWRNMTKEQAIYGSIQGLLAVAVVACGAVSKNQKSTELPPMGQATIGLITEASAGSDLLLNQQLAGVKTLSGRADCLPQLVAVDGGNLGAETVGLCQVNTKDGQGTEVIVRKQKGGDQQTIKQMLTARTSPETLYFEYGSGGGKKTLFTYDVSSGATQWILPDGGVVEFAKGQSPFEAMIGKILDPGNVVQAAEATQVYDPTKPAVVTVTPDGRVTVTQEPTVSLLTPLDTAWVESNWKMTDLSSPGKFTPEISRISKGGLRITGEFNGALDFNIFDDQGSLVLRIGNDGKVLLLDKSANTNQASTVIGNVNASGNYSLEWEIKPDGSMRIILDGTEVLTSSIPSEVLDFSDGGVKAILSQKDGSGVHKLGVGTIDKSPINPADPIPAPTATVGQGEGGLPIGAVRFDEGGIKGIRSPVPIPGYEPRFSNGYAVLDCRVNQSCSEIKPFNSLQEAQEYWKKIYPNAMFKYEYWLFDDGGIARVLVELVGIGN